MLLAISCFMIFVFEVVQANRIARTYFDEDEEVEAEIFMSRAPLEDIVKAQTHMIYSLMWLAASTVFALV